MLLTGANPKRSDAFRGIFLVFSSGHWRSRAKQWRVCARAVVAQTAPVPIVIGGAVCVVSEIADHADLLRDCCALFVDLKPGMAVSADCESLSCRLTRRRLIAEKYLAHHLLSDPTAAQTEALTNAYWFLRTGNPAGQRRIAIWFLCDHSSMLALFSGTLCPLKSVAACESFRG